MNLKNDITKDIKQGKTPTKQLTDDIDNAFEEVLYSPDNKTISDYKKKETAIITTYLATMGTMISSQLILAAQNGIDGADKTLSANGITEKVKNVEPSVYNDAVKFRYDSMMTNLQKVGASISSNTNNAISNIKNVAGALTLEEQTKASENILKLLKDKSITSFKDAGGKTWTVERYENMLMTTEVMRATRQSLFTRFLEYGQDLVIVRHIGISPECPLCAKWNGQTLSITGDNKDYASLADAELEGLHHINCDHAEYEIPKDVNLSNELVNLPVENPMIDGKMVKGVYSQEGLQRLDDINNIFKNLGYDPSAHAMEMAYNRTNNVNQLINTLKNGEIFIDDQGAKTYFKDRLGIHTDAETKSIITVIPRGKTFNPATKWKKYE